MTSNRIANQGGAYDFFHRDQQPLEHPEEIQEDEFFINSEKSANGVTGLALGDGFFLHQGSVEEVMPMALDKDLEAHYDNQCHVVSRFETEAAFEDMNAEFSHIENEILSAEPHFDYQTGRASLTINYANGKSKIVKRSNLEIASWIMSEAAKRVID